MKKLLSILLLLLLSITFSFAQTTIDQGVKEVTINFPIGGITYSATPPPGKITITGSDGGGGTGSTVDYPGGKDYQFKDKAGNIWTVDENGTVTQNGKVAEGGASNSTNTDGVTGSGNNATVNQYTAKGIKIVWEENSSGKYAYDTQKKTNLPVDKYSSVKDADGSPVSVSYKATVNKQTELFDAKVSITDPALKDAKIEFKTLSIGKAIPAKELNKTDTERTYQLELVGAFDYAEEEVIAVVVPKDSTAKQQVISSFRLVHLSPKTVDVSLVPLDNNSQSKLQSQGDKLNQIYKKIGINFNVKKEPVLDVSTIVSGDTINSEDADLMSTYSPQQQQINALYKGTDARYVLFVTDKKSSTGQNGYMRLNGQFGYVYNNAQDKTGAHELGHGIFKLEHPWKAYGTTQSATPLLMDYSTGEELSHLDWKQINDPAFKLYTFQSQSSGEFSDIQLTPEWEPFKFSGSSIYISGDIKTPNGAVHGIAMCKNDNCSEKEYYYWTNEGNKKGYYAKGISEPLSITYLKQDEKDKNPAITLFWNYGSCGYNKTYSTTWNYIKDKKGFDLTKITDENSIKYKETIPCVDGSGSTTNSEDTCVGKDVAQINQGYNKVLGIIDSEDKAIITQNINDADICSVRLLSYDQIIKLFIKLAGDNNIAEGKEKAIVKLVASIKSEKFKDFFNLVQADNNKILRNLMFKIDDKTFFYGANNYTNLVKLFLQMFNDVNKDILKGINADELKAYTVVQNSYLTPSNNEPIFHMYFQNDKPELQISQGVWEVTQDCHWVAESGGDGYEECTTSQKVNYADPVYVKPFDMVVLADNSDYNLINGITDDTKKVTVIPAIILFYAHEKGQVENIKIYVQNTLDVVTLLVPVTKIATGPKWLAKTFTFVDKWSKVNAGVNLAVNNTPLNQIPEIKAALDAYNAVTAAMNVTSLAGSIGKGKIAKFFNEVDNPAAKQILLNQAKNGSDDAKKILDVEAELKAYSEAKLGKGWWKNLDDVDNGWQWANVSDYLISLQSNYGKVFNKIKNWPENEIKLFMEKFPTENSLKILNVEDNLVDVWKKWTSKGINSIDDLKAFRKVWNNSVRGVSFDDFYQKTSYQIGKANGKKFAPELYEIWSKGKGHEKELQSLYQKYGLNPLEEYPPCEGIWGIIKRIKPSINEVFDRFQTRANLGGGYAGVIEQSDNVFTISSRALKENYSEIVKNGENYYYFKFKFKNVPDDLVFEYGEAIPWFNELGGAIQIKSSKGLHELSNEIELLETWRLVNGIWKK